MSSSSAPVPEPSSEERRPAGAPEGDAAERSGADVLGAAIGGAARRAGIDPAEDAATGQVVWKAMGGVRGVLESILPSLVFVVVYTLRPDPLALSLGLSVGIAAVFTLVRIVQKSPPAAALGGLIAAGAAAALALFTGQGRDNFVIGLVTNAVYGTAFLVSALIGWSLIGLAVGFLTGDGTAWRGDRRKRRVYFWLAITWAALFYARLAVQLPLYLANETALLGTFKLLMGLPLFAPVIAVTWLAVRGLQPSATTR